MTNQERADRMATNLQLLCKLLPMTVEEYAAAIGTTRQSVYRWIKKEAPMPVMAYLATKYICDQQKEQSGLNPRRYVIADPVDYLVHGVIDDDMGYDEEEKMLILAWLAKNVQSFRKMKTTESGWPVYFRFAQFIADNRLFREDV